MHDAYGMRPKLSQNLSLNGFPVKLFFDDETGLLVREIRYIEAALGRILPVSNHLVEIRANPGRGRGLFAREAIAARTLIEVAPVIILPSIQCAALDRTDFLMALAREKVPAFHVDLDQLREEISRG